jgi:GT2 family glycosyltransferase
MFPAMTAQVLQNVGIVIIGRNEGDRLVRCFESLQGWWTRCVYVDSGSTDDSVQQARSRGIDAVGLDMSIPFTAARARNAGFAIVVAKCPDIDYVQFFDGDCEVLPGWMVKAARYAQQNSRVGLAFGLQKERFPDRSIYNTLFNVEWDTPIGEVRGCAGNALIRRRLFEQLGGYRENVIAAEDSELCVRIRGAGFLVWHLDEPMVLHDANVMHFSQWWKRAKRGGYAYADGVSMHGAPPELHFVREMRSVIVWGMAIPLAVLLLSFLLTPWWLLAGVIYPVQILRIALKGRRTPRVNWLYATFVLVAKFPEAAGIIKFYRDRWLHKPKVLIEYK